ncbi:hypothetical protein [Streptomyces cathayae]|uniref:Secreted protein n=1 Tax=Streptomyces cathayae TaxID=3031124 RepID=A0ABY8K8Z5_9ACTN|nr:hypothetical protein [Streptomyces sp. HUAS 5]WGD44732.1 hypothetical protein PYS65_33980 [Streptomyces sp. HUAS 5]
MIEWLVRSMIALSSAVRSRAGSTPMFSMLHASLKCWALKILALSTTTVLGRTTGRAAAPAMRGSPAAICS